MAGLSYGKSNNRCTKSYMMQIREHSNKSTWILGTNGECGDDVIKKSDKVPARR